MADLKFTVDTHLFRELGELLVGRDSTALVELLKNSYDADATRVTVYGERLEHAEQGFIRVSDNGHGMTAKTFETSFLRIASRAKDIADPLSPRFRRHFTGAKGIGRLAAHKLARLMEIESVYADPISGKAIEGFRACIDWKKVESAETLGEIPNDAITVNLFKVRPTDQSGTTLTLRKLRTKWTDRERALFTSEASASQIPKILSAPLPKSVLARPLLFEAPNWISQGATNANWDLNLEGDFSVGDDYLVPAANSASWILEIEATAERVRVALAPSVAYERVLRTAERIERDLTGLFRPDGSPSFQSRILIRDGDWNPGGDAAKRWRRADACGVRVYLEGFRVLPYGESGNDWLRIDSTYTRRLRGDGGLSKGLFDDDELNKDSYLSYLPARQYLGGAFLTLDQSKGLKMVVNREGFIPNAAFHYLDEVISAAISIAVVERSKAKLEKTEERRDARLASAASKFQAKQTPAKLLEESLLSSKKRIKEARRAVASGDVAQAQSLLDQAEETIKDPSSLVGDIRDEQAMIRILASLGTHTAGFVHELKGLLAIATVVELQLSKIDRDDSELSPSDRKRLKTQINALREMRIGLERQAAYVSDFSSTDARRRRSRHEFAAVFDAALEGYAQQIASRESTTANEIAVSIKSPPMFRAELLAIFSNLISNALKAAGRCGKIRASSSQQEGRTIIRVENTGMAVDIKNSEQWFRPFATSSSDTNPDLGRGMGLGLTITRRMLEEYGAEIRFVRPRTPYVTCVEIEFHG